MSSNAPTRVFLSLGSNLGDREIYLKNAVEGLKHTAANSRIRVSPIYETEPCGVANQPWYLNMVVELEFAGTPDELLDDTQALEYAAGRERNEKRWSARTLDIDIILFGELAVSSDILTIPHPRLLQRRFVLQPLADLAGDLILPGVGMTVAEALKKL